MPMSPDDKRPEPFWSDEPVLGEGEIFSALGERRGTTLFLGKFTMTEVLAVLGRQGFLKEAKKRDLWPLFFDLDSAAYPLQRLRIYRQDKTPDSLIVDLKIREGPFTPQGDLPAEAPRRSFASLLLEWLTLQNPSAEFSERHGALPGQQHPGLGMSRKVMDIFTYLGKVMRKDAILAFPAFYHNAILFSRYFRFFDPRKEGEILSLRRTFSHMPIKQLAWAVHLNCLRTADGRPYEWASSVQVYPLAKDLKDYLDSRAYKTAVKEALKASVFQLDAEEFDRKVGSID
jgi:hypothetical protein